MNKINIIKFSLLITSIIFLCFGIAELFLFFSFLFILSLNIKEKVINDKNYLIEDEKK